MSAVEGLLHYLAPMTERPYYYIGGQPPDGMAWRNTRGDHRTVPIHDARGLDAPSLEVEGFALVRHETAVSDLYDEDAIRAHYYPEMERLVARATGAGRVVAFDHNLRSAPRAERGDAGLQHPVRFVHNDYTEASGPQRVRDLLPDEAEALLRSRVAVINVWKPIRGPVEETPLAFCDAQSLDPGDFIETELRYPGRTGEIYSLHYRPGHRWFSFSAMEADEALLLKCYDSERDRARFTAHSAFDDPNTPAEPAPRESVEVRTLAFFPGA